MEYEINGRIIQLVSGIFEADSLEDAQDLAEIAFAEGNCMFGDTEVEVELPEEDY
jgi:hypothetical protein